MPAYPGARAHQYVPISRAVEIMIENLGTHFDADMIDAFVEIQEEFRAIALRFADSDADMDMKQACLAQAGVACWRA
jgi:putative two-component system response regulator